MKKFDTTFDCCEGWVVLCHQNILTVRASVPKYRHFAAERILSECGRRLQDGGLPGTGDPESPRGARLPHSRASRLRQEEYLKRAACVLMHYAKLRPTHPTKSLLFQTTQAPRH